MPSATSDNAYGLTPRQWRFVQEYLVDLNATAAYQRAGYRCATSHVAEASGLRLLRNARVLAAIQAEKACLVARIALKQDAVVEEIAVISHSTIEHYQIDAQGNVVLSPGAPTQAMRAVASLKKRVMHTDAGVTYETEIKLWSKPSALRMAGEYLSLFDGGSVQSVDIQAAQAKREAALLAVKQQLQKIRERHQQSSEVIA